MGKFIVFIFMTFVISVAFTMSLPQEEAYANYYDNAPNYTSVVEVTEATEEDFTELYIAFANKLFDFMAKLVRSKVDIILWIKKFLLQLVLPYVIRFKQWLVYYPDQVHSVVSLLLSGLKYLSDLVQSYQGPIVAVLQTAVNVGRVFMEQGWDGWKTEAPLPHPHYEHY